MSQLNRTTAPDGVPTDVYGRPLPKWDGWKSLAVVVAVGGIFYLSGKNPLPGRSLAFGTSDGGVVRFFDREPAPPPSKTASAGTMLGLFMASSGVAILIYGMAKSEKMKQGAVS